MEPSIPTVRLLGLPLAELTRDEVVDHIFDELNRGVGGWVITPNVDYLRRYATEPDAKPLFAAADLIVADGIPLLWAARLQGTPLPDRVAGSDLVWLLAERAGSEGRSLYLIGGESGAGEAAARRFADHSPGLKIAGISMPRVSAQPTNDEIQSLRASIAEAQPDLVFVALGAPKEERVIAALRPCFPATWWIGVGISLSFVAGMIERAPLWVQRLGFEWAHRLVQEPRRLAWRYLMQDLPFAFRLFYKAWRGRT